MTAPALPSSDYPAASVARRSLVILVLLGVLATMDITLTALLIEPLKHELHLTDIEIGLLQGTVFGLSYGLSALTMGWLIDRQNRTRLLIGGMLVWALAMAGSGLSHSFGMLVVWRVALGLVTALLVPASLSIIADLFPPERRAVATSLFGGGQASGQAFGILIGGTAFDLLARHAPTIAGLTPWRTIYLAAAGVCMVLILLLFTLREPVRQEAEAVGQVGGWRELWAFRRFLLPLLAGLLFSVIAVQGANIWAAPLLMRNYHLSPGDFAGWLSAVTLAGLILGTLAGGQLAELGRRRSGRAGVLFPAVIAAFVSAPLSFFAIAPNVPAFAALLAFDLVCAGVVPTIGLVALTLYLPNGIRGRGIAAYVLTIALLGSATAPAAIALISRALGGEAMLGHAIVVLSVPAALLSGCCFLLAMRAAPAPPSAKT
jgi:MFS family permease